ncbi:TPA: TetR/AcrR family transcriptional regulator [Enterobacter hormaechei]|uniref:TetR/AcrR family transcriptional regulator n=2 Tax=Enterobacteriaceae TaxID=543 RepID=A0A9X7KXF5_9ENTR|nr:MULTISPECIES: TetR/AcrR family transcriptional regulator [Enterobacteriaceae]EDP8718348.1 TetR/AcrR family transcriptional regulator [Salmonella enterica subsp. enterica]MCL5621536.1 TetR/AcrR family transcriptional regulator [Escherichia coli]MCU2585250.1 TetR/AcrR family transcriptional regulator [Enterobacter hormaechei subsp. steigerwaltii]CAH5930943.1 putative HTH-type transcriptional regulator YvdT [Klebsiella pneumoniae]HBZ9029731.1 TetR/AcrR family transcriptional regulator [Raoulte
MGKTLSGMSTRTRILKAARECFAENGFHNTSMKTICKASDMSPGTLYHHFVSKEALIQAIILEDQERALTRFRHPLEGVGLVDYLVDSMIDVTHEDCAQRALVMEIMAEGMRNPQVADMLKSKYQTITDFLVARFNDAQAKGEIGNNINNRKAARLLLSLTYGILSDIEADENSRDADFAMTFRDMIGGMLHVGNTVNKQGT